MVLSSASHYYCSTLPIDHLKRMAWHRWYTTTLYTNRQNTRKLSFETRTFLSDDFECTLNCCSKYNEVFLRQLFQTLCIKFLLSASINNLKNHSMSSIWLSGHNNCHLFKLLIISLPFRYRWYNFTANCYWQINLDVKCTRKKLLLENSVQGNQWK